MLDSIRKYTKCKESDMVRLEVYNTNGKWLAELSLNGEVVFSSDCSSVTSALNYLDYQVECYLQQQGGVK